MPYRSIDESTLILCKLIFVAFVIGATVSQTMASPCDLSQLILSKKQSPLDEHGSYIVQLAGTFDFKERPDDLVDITETVSLILPDASSAVAALVKSHLGALPDDDCGTSVSQRTPFFTSEVDGENVRLEFKVLSTACFAGISAEVARGSLIYDVKPTPKITHDTLVVTATPSQNGDIQSTIPDFDRDLSAEIDREIAHGNETISSRFTELSAKLQEKLDEAAKEAVKAFNDENPLYKPKLVSARLYDEYGALILRRIRTSQARARSACAIRRLANEMWNDAR